MRRKMFVIILLMVISAAGYAQWERAGFEGNSVHKIFHFKEILFAVSYGGVYTSADYGVSWDSIGFITSLYIDDVTAIGDTLLACVSWACTDFCQPAPCIFKSTDGGISWQNVHEDYFGGTYIVSNNQTIFCNVKSELTKSTDFGNTWNQVIPNPPHPTYYDHLFVYRNSLYASSYTEGIYKSTNDGIDWIHLIEGIPSSGSMYFTSNESFLFAARSSKVYRSSDEGASWEELDLTNLPGISIYLMQCTNELIFAAGKNQNYRLTTYAGKDNGNFWCDISEGIDTSFINIPQSLTVDDKYLYMATWDGVWRFDYNLLLDLDDEFENNPIEFSLFQNYPNPFNSTAKIKFTLTQPLSRGERVTLQHLEQIKTTLKVYDVLGRDISTLVNEEKLPGTYEEIFDASNLSSGVYYYVLRVAGKLFSRKMCLIK